MRAHAACTRPSRGIRVYRFWEHRARGNMRHIQARGARGACRAWCTVSCTRSHERALLCASTPARLNPLLVLLSSQRTCRCSATSTTAGARRACAGLCCATGAHGARGPRAPPKHGCSAGAVPCTAGHTGPVGAGGRVPAHLELDFRDDNGDRDERV